MSPPPTNSLLDLNHIHQELDEIFFEHQKAVLSADGPRVLALFQAYENSPSEPPEGGGGNPKLPLYREKGRAPSGWGPWKSSAARSTKKSMNG